MTAPPTQIRRFERISTGTVDIHPQHAYGTSAPLYWWILTSRQWLTGLPINVYVIEHRDGLVVFDTGQDRASVTNPGYFPRGPLGIVYERLARFDIPEDQTLANGLRAAGYDPGDVDLALISHLHQDHIGGLGELPNAQIVLTREERATMNGLLPEANGILRSHLDFPADRWRTIQFEPVAGIPGFERGFDLFGDGTLTLVPTPGHTPGSMSLLVRDPSLAPSLLVGDVTYDAGAMIASGTIPGVGSRPQLVDTTQRIRHLASNTPDLRILAAHDPATVAIPATLERTTR